MPFESGEYSLFNIYVDMDVHGLFMSATPLLWSDTFRNEAHFNYLFNTISSSTNSH